jgi:hypothetical protein
VPRHSCEAATAGWFELSPELSASYAKLQSGIGDKIGSVIGGGLERHFDNVAGPAVQRQTSLTWQCLAIPIKAFTLVKTVT